MDHTSSFNPSNSSPLVEPNTSSQSTPRNPQSLFATNIAPQLNQQFQSQFPPNFNPFNPYGFPPNFNPYNLGNPYEGNFNLSPNGVFGRGAAVEGVRSSSPVESMPFVLGAGSSSPASSMSIRWRCISDPETREPRHTTGSLAAVRDPPCCR